MSDDRGDRRAGGYGNERRRGYSSRDNYRQQDRRNDSRGNGSASSSGSRYGSRDDYRSGRRENYRSRGVDDRRRGPSRYAKGDYGPVLARELDSTYEEKVNRNYANSIFVGNLTYDCTPEDLRDYFSGIGEVVRADIITSKGHHRGMGTVEFTNSRDVEEAIRQYDSSYFMDRQIFVRQDNPPPDNGRNERTPSRRTTAPSSRQQDISSGAYSMQSNMKQGYEIFVANLPYSINWQALKDMFKECGDVMRADVELDRAGRSRGFGTVIFRTRDDMERAIDRYNRFEVDGRTLDVREGHSNNRNDDMNIQHQTQNAMTNDATSDATSNERSLPTQPSEPASNRTSTFTEGVVEGGERNTLIYCSNLPPSTARSDLYDLFESIGKVRNAELKYDRNGETTGVAIVEFISQDDADVCIERLNKYNYGGCDLEISYAKRV
ncbi:hypothetical protein NCAS_0G04280 [Naumovozyma castellii]|uniref:RRM domain-containing protein n=1 Tax=Naumovozyma castellii TaxID=27288 RepID=G0VHK8_NAUCA|nr:hypothetical protein NCAS_0G04280 [Naumovozyma castellii CBS 4309]CCC71315.1 hypothetical protein NCAS_0G04280 [Naumovozyma castellii CBS 4309]